MLTLYRDPWNLIEQFRDADNAGPLPSIFRSGLMPESGSDSYRPPVDIETRDDRYLLQIDMPGVQLKDMEITTDQGVLTVRGKRSREKSSEKDGCHRFERIQGMFERVFTLPEDIDADKIKAEAKQGVLSVTLLRLKKKEPGKSERRIEVTERSQENSLGA